MTTTVKIDINPIVILNNHGYPAQARMFLANEIARISDAYVPFLDGSLKNSVEIADGGRALIYGGSGVSNAYARYQWFGKSSLGKPLNYHGAPVRGSRWVERAFNSNRQQLLASMQRMANKGGFR